MRAELTCSGCSLVVADALVLPGSEKEFTANERYALESDDSTIRPQLQFSTRDAFGRPVGQQKVWLLRRTAQTYNPAPGERSMWQMEARIKRLASQLRLPQTIAVRAIYLFRRAKQLRLVKKPGLDDWARSLLLAACRETRYIITFADLVVGDRQQKNRSIGKVRKYYHLICKTLALDVQRPSIENFITYYAGKLQVNGPVVSAAIGIAKPYMDEKPGDTAYCVAAGALFIAMRNRGSDVTQKRFSRSVNISEITLRKWADNLGGYTSEVNDVRDVATDDIGDDFSPKASPSPPKRSAGSVREHKNSDAEDDAENRSQNPPSVKQPKRNDDDARDGHRRKSPGPRRQKGRNPR